MSNNILRKYIQEALVSPSVSYMKKEKLREFLQNHIVNMVVNKEIKSPDELNEFFSSIDLALLTLKSIPYEVWQKIALKK